MVTIIKWFKKPFTMLNKLMNITSSYNRINVGVKDRVSSFIQSLNLLFLLFLFMMKRQGLNPPFN